MPSYETCLTNSNSSLISARGHERLFYDFRGTSASPPTHAVRVDIPAWQRRARKLTHALRHAVLTSEVDALHLIEQLRKFCQRLCCLAQTFDDELCGGAQGTAFQRN